MRLLISHVNKLKTPENCSVTTDRKLTIFAFISGELKKPAADERVQESADV
jgi:hypothetical protein